MSRIVHRQLRGSRASKAYTLVEIMATLSVLMMLGVAASSLLSKVTQIGVQTNHEKASRQMVIRLSRQLRDDVLNYDSVDFASDGSALRLRSNEAVVAYQIDDEPVAIQRTVTQSGETRSQESYPLPNQCAPEFSQSDDAIALRLTAKEQRNTWIVEAVRP